MSDAAGDVRCPRCDSPVYRYGRDPRNRKQRYRCKNASCRHQFAPGHVRPPRKYPKVVCPRCGANMSIFKHLSDALRFRCNRYNAKGARRCTHKVNIPLPGQKAFHLVVDPKDIRLVQGKIQPIFYWKKMKFSSSTVAIALYFSFFRAMPAPSVVQTLRDLYQITVSHDTITRWSHKAAFLLADKCGKLTLLPKKRGRKPRILADETQFKRRGKKRWLWLNYVPRYDVYLGHNLSARRDTQAARDTFAMTYHASPGLKKAQVLTDGLWSYASALGDLDVEAKDHLVYKSFFEMPNNNRLERKWSNFKTRARPFRGFKSDLGLMAFAESQIVYHNVFKPSVRLKGLTPAQALGAQLPDAPNPWMLLTRLLTS
jgi:transposase-like protein